MNNLKISDKEQNTSIAHNTYLADSTPTDEKLPTIPTQNVPSENKKIDMIQNDRVIQSMEAWSD